MAEMAHINIINTRRLHSASRNARCGSSHFKHASLAHASHDHHANTVTLQIRLAYAYCFFEAKVFFHAAYPIVAADLPFPPMPRTVRSRCGTCTCLGP